MIRKSYPYGIRCKKTSCRNSKTIHDPETGELICSNCGEVLKTLRTSNEKRQIFTQEEYEKQSRIGGPSSLRLADKGLSTMIGKSKTSFGKQLSTESKKRYGRLKFWDARLKSKTTSYQNLRKGLILIETLRTKLSLTERIAEDAAYIYRKAHEKKLSRGRTIKLLATASIYSACRANSVPRNLNEFSKKANVDRKQLSSMYREMSKSLKLKYAPYTPESFVSKITTKLQLPEKVHRKVLSILKKANEEGISVGKRPLGLAAAAVYLACILYNLNINQKQVSNAAGISSVTIRKWYGILYESFND